jgi:hypothetical protein
LYKGFLPLYIRLAPWNIIVIFLNFIIFDYLTLAIFLYFISFFLLTKNSKCNRQVTF